MSDQRAAPGFGAEMAAAQFGVVDGVFAATPPPSICGCPSRLAVIKGGDRYVVATTTACPTTLG